MNTILIVEDDTSINNMLNKLLTLNGYEVICAFSGTEGVLIHNEKVNLILLDLMLPGKTGEEIIKELKKKVDVPVIVMSAIHEVNKKLDLFSLGADDYVTKPFDNEELLARIKVQLKHKENHLQNNTNLKFKDIILDIENYTVKCNNVDVNLSKTEFELLKTLMKNPNKVFSKSSLFDTVWNYEESADDNTLNVHISKIRSKLKQANPNNEYIETIWSVGYKMKK